MSVQTYNYEAHLNWKWHDSVSNPLAIPTEETVKAQLTTDLQTAFLAEFAAKLAAAGHWYKMDNVVTTFTKYTGTWGFPAPLPPFFIDVEGTTVIYFETDVKDATAHASPQLWQIIQDSIGQIAAWLGAHPEVVVAIFLAGFFTVLYLSLVNTTTGAIQTLGSNIGSLAITLGILAVAGIAIYALFFTATGRKAASKGYETARRGYRAVRERLE